MKSVHFNSKAEDELSDAVAFYEREREGLGGEFLNEVDRSLEFAIQFPKAAPIVRGSGRSLVVSRFPYSIIYRLLKSGNIRILAIAHQKRRPGYWSGR